MNILFVTPVFVEKGKAATGMPNYIYRTALFLEKHGNHCCVVTGAKKNRKVLLSGITVYEVYTDFKHYDSCLMERVYRKLGQEKAIQLKVNEVILKENISIIQYAGHFGTGFFYHYKNCKVPAVMRMSSYAKFYFAKDHVHSDMEENCISMLERYACRRMCSVYAPSRVLAYALEQDLGKKVGVIEPPFYIENVQEDDSLYRKMLHKKDYFLFVGTMIENKGVMVISEILDRLLTEHPDHYFVFCGANGLFEGEKTIDRIIKDNSTVRKRILYLGEISHEKLYPVIRNAAFVVLPSLMENLSNACMEAMYLKKIVIATDGTSYEQLIEDGKSGFLAIPGDARSLYQKICEALSRTPEERTEICENAKKRVDRLSPEMTVFKLLRYYQYICKKYTSHQISRNNKKAGGTCNATDL